MFTLYSVQPLVVVTKEVWMMFSYVLYFFFSLLPCHRKTHLSQCMVLF